MTTHDPLITTGYGVAVRLSRLELIELRDGWKARPLRLRPFPDTPTGYHLYTPELELVFATHRRPRIFVTLDEARAFVDRALEEAPV